MANKKSKTARKKKKAPDGMLADAARAIGSALGTLSVQADALATKAKTMRLPTAAEAKNLVNLMLSTKKQITKQITKQIAKKKHSRTRQK